jgi:ActR/RegA family two-component response regulator
VLLVDDDPGTLQGFSGVLKCGGFDVATAETGRAALSAAETQKLDLVLADLLLSDASGLDVLRGLREKRNPVPLVIVTGFGSTQSAVEAIRAGACDFVEKPLIGDDLIRVVARAIGTQPAPASPERSRGASPERSRETCPEPRRGADRPRAHAAARWAHVVVATVESATDPRTLKAWGRQVGASQGALKNWCRIAGLSPRRSLLFARLLRAVVRHRFDNCRPADVLDIVDYRTLSRLLQLGGVPRDCTDLPHQVKDFLANQRLVRDTIALREVEQVLIEEGLWGPADSCSENYGASCNPS